MNYNWLANPSLLVLMIFAGGATAVTPGCGSGTMNSGASGSGASNSVGDTGGGSASNTECPSGSERCACYDNGTCNTGLVCASKHCVNVDGLVGSTGGTSANGNGGTSATGGAANTDSTITGGFPSISSTGNTNTTGGSITAGGAPGTGGAIATGGAPGTGGSIATGGALGTGGVSFWKTVTYNANSLPDPADGNHNAGLNCIQCHTRGTSSEAPTWLFGGTVYKADGTTPAPHVQVGVNDGTNLYTAYSATNGNFWFGGSGTINWATAQVRIRNSNGESMMAGATPAATCNLCHNATTYPRITAP